MNQSQRNEVLSANARLCIEQTGGDISKIAKRLNMNNFHAWHHLKKFDLVETMIRARKKTEQIHQQSFRPLAAQSIQYGEDSIE